MRLARLVLLLLLVPYAAWFVRQREDGFYYVLLAMSVAIPLVLSQCSNSRLISTIASLLVSPAVIFVVLYSLACGEYGLRAGLLVAALVLALTAPVWAIISIVAGAMKATDQKDSAEQAH